MINENYDLEAKLLARNWSLTAVSGLVLLGRIYSRLWKQRLALWWDDWIIVLTWLLLLITSIYSIFQLRGSGVPVSDLTAQERTDFMFWTQLVATIAVITSASAKTGFCATLIRASTPQLLRQNQTRNSGSWSQSSAETARPQRKWRDNMGNWQWGMDWPTGGSNRKDNKEKEKEQSNSKWRDSSGNWQWPKKAKNRQLPSMPNPAAPEEPTRNWRDSAGNWQWGLSIRGQTRQIWLRWTSWIVLVAVNIVSLLAGVLIWTRCNPIAKTYRPDVSGQCFSNTTTSAIFTSNNAFSGAMDLILSVLPLLILWGKGLTRGQKLGVTAAAAFVKAAETQLNMDGDPTITGASYLVWGAVESHVIVIAASLPSLGYLIWPPREDDRIVVPSTQTWRIPTPEGLREAMDRPVTTADLLSTGQTTVRWDLDKAGMMPTYPKVVPADIERTGEAPWPPTSMMARPRPKSSNAMLRPPPVPVKDARRDQRSKSMISGSSANAMFI
ncbi:hypothetical protein PpBr36_04075 [Pyricularia pennisetigena]|uniref:hypothetical protein n=1 Tax=Pyricularia pennisetigena TaxID=1578925 RepID=UPI00114F3ECE|nr:hypothetical protein PpBr36_04075 [Pyricularia pennisetigena]TLS26559.1 hypothetical protein PpBr36_04075 [Pyricularia pennisetigena]